MNLDIIVQCANHSIQRMTRKVLRGEDLGAPLKALQSPSELPNLREIL